MDDIKQRVTAILSSHLPEGVAIEHTPHDPHHEYRLVNHDEVITTFSTFDVMVYKMTNAFKVGVLITGGKYYHISTMHEIDVEVDNGSDFYEDYGISPLQEKLNNDDG